MELEQVVIEQIAPEVSINNRTGSLLWKKAQ